MAEPDSTSTATRRARVVLVHPRRLVAEALAERLTRGGFDVTTIVASPDERVWLRVQFVSPAVVVILLDSTYAAESSDIRKLLTDDAVPTLVLVDPNDTRTAIRAIDDGAVGFTSTDEGLDQLLTAVDQATGGHPVYNHRDLELLRRQQNREDEQRRARLALLMSLSPREEQILADMVSGQTADFIAQARGISLSTVRTHVKRILKKLHVSSQIEAVAAANQAGWRSPRRSA